VGLNVIQNHGNPLLGHFPIRNDALKLRRWWQTAARIEPEALGRPFDSTAHDVIRQMGCTTLEIGQHLANAEDIGQGV
jgi:hypothetical protein